LLSKGLNKNDIEDYFYENKEELNLYEQNSAKNIVYKKQRDMEPEEIKQYLLKKGYSIDNINSIFKQ
jgi:SOS response regulatory protein OraA/RecX